MTVSKPTATPFRRFRLYRLVDATGVSGTGHVAEGVQFSDGVVSLHWVTKGPRSTAVYNSLEDLEEIHGHQGNTLVKWAE